MQYNTLVMKFEKEYFVDLISLRLGFTAKKEKIYIDFVFLFLLIYWLYQKSGNADVIKGRVALSVMLTRYRVFFFS
jgi:hypothetical protein